MEDHYNESLICTKFSYRSLLHRLHCLPQIIIGAVNMIRTKSNTPIAINVFCVPEAASQGDVAKVKTIPIVLLITEIPTIPSKTISGYTSEA
jgi:hypothetical protein